MKKKENEYNLCSYSRNKADTHSSGQAAVTEHQLRARHSAWPSGQENKNWSLRSRNSKSNGKNKQVITTKREDAVKLSRVATDWEGK